MKSTLDRYSRPGSVFAPSPSKKQLVSVRYSPEVLAYFKATGEGWQARMNGVLKDYVDTRGIRRSRGSA